LSKVKALFMALKALEKEKQGFCKHMSLLTCSVISISYGLDKIVKNYERF
jgi:hypothetical protein